VLNMNIQNVSQTMAMNLHFLIHIQNVVLINSMILGHLWAVQFRSSGNSLLLNPEVYCLPQLVSIVSHFSKVPYL
jgi:hypothetical protein